MDNDKAKLRWEVEQQPELIKCRRFWERHLNRGDSTDQLGVLVNQASIDLNGYIGFAPQNIVYDKSARTYVGGPEYANKVLQTDASRHLTQQRSIADGIINRNDTSHAVLSTYDSAPTAARGVNPVVLQSDVGAIHRSEAIEVKYPSLSRPEPHWQWIAPNAIGFDGFRWHTPAVCIDDEAFKDFLFSRMFEIRGPQASSFPAEAKVIALRYGMRGGKTKIKVRRALLNYALRCLGLYTDPSGKRPKDQQIVPSQQVGR